MPLKITWKYLVAFIALNMIMGELHEQAHIQMGYAICGCYGERDFNVWEICANCAHASLSYLATSTGPLFSYLVYWYCALVLLKSNKAGTQKTGMAVLFATVPFARIFTACLGGGDEKTVLLNLLGDHFSVPVIKVIAAVLVMAFCLPPLFMAIKKFPKKNRWWCIIGFNVAPLFFGILWQRIFLNPLLNLPIWNGLYIAGAPVFVILHFAAMLLLLLLFRKALSGESSVTPVS